VTLPTRSRFKLAAYSAGFGFLMGALAVGVLWMRPAFVFGTPPAPVRVEGAPMMEITPTAPEEPSPVAPPPTPAPAAPPAIGAEPLDDLRQRRLEMPVKGATRDALHQSFDDARGSSRKHEAIDILAPMGTPVVAVEDGTIAKLFVSDAGGITVYQFDPSATYCYYYAHLQRYAGGLQDGARVTRGQVLGYVGVSGNAPKDTPHLHFAIFKLAESRKWWQGTAIDPFVVMR
jgi:murein DD-endopeptidase MepM/ murein hydrolase activator NlpD